MTIFWILTAVMTLAAIAAVVPALFSTRRAAALNRDRQNVAIARERLADLERERESGGLTDEAYGQARSELERALADDLGADAAAAPAPGGSGRWALPVVLALVPLVAFGVYWQLGSPEHIEVAGASAGAPASSAPHAGATGETPSVEELVARLEQRLEQDPGRADGWYLLGRTYMSMQRYPQAVGAFEKLHELVGDQPGVLVALADAQAMAQGSRMAGRPAELVQKALAQDPENRTALWLAGRAEAEAGNHVEAIRYLRRVEAQSVNDPQVLAEIRGQIAALQQQGGLADDQVPAAPDTPAPAGASVIVQVSLSDEVAARAAPEDTVFVYARAVEGPPMPLAVARHQVRELPLTVTLTDEMAMMPQMKMSNFPEVRISARVSKTGNAMTQPGDLVSDDVHVAVAAAAAEPLVLVIDRVNQ